MGSVNDLAGRRLYLDANLFVYALEDIAPWGEPAKAVFRLVEHGRASAVTSELTLGECLTKPFRDGNDDVAQVYLDAISDQAGLSVVPVTRPVLIETAGLRAANRSLKTPDALHAATAVLTGCDVLLTNDARFRAAVAGVEILLLSDLTP